MKKSIITTIILSIGMSNYTPVHAQDFIQQAMVQSANGKYQDALILLNRQISKNPTDHKAYMLLSEIQMKLGKVDLAAATYGALESMGLVSDELFYAYGTSLKMLGKYDDAIAKFKLCSTQLRDKANTQIESCYFAKELIKSENAKKVMNMDINSEYNEFSPAVYDNTLVFSSNKVPFMSEISQNQLSGYAGQYVCKSLMNGSAAALLLENKSFVANMETFNLNDNKNVVYSVSSSPASDLNTRMLSSKLFTGNYNGHSTEGVEEFPFNEANSSIFSGTMSNDGNTIIFASNRAGGFGGFDLYRSTYTEGAWSQPANLGGIINTIGNEVTPQYNSGILWFASDSHNGLGGYDIYSALEINNEFEQISNLGHGVNSSMDDLFPYVKNLVLYFSSEREGKGGFDIYRSPLSESQYSLDAILNSAGNIAINDNSISSENVPQAIALNSSANLKGYASPSAAMSTARRVSLREVFTKDRPVVFFIQLASVTANTKNADKYKSLVKYGNIYKINGATTAKIRLGYFLERDETARLLGKVKNAGFKDAFIVSQELDNDAMEILISQSEYTTQDVVSTNAPAPKPQNKKETSQILEGTTLPKTRTPQIDNENIPAPKHNAIERQYKVRIGAFEDPIWFESNKVQDLGKIEQWTKGSWTIFILSGFDDFSNAEKARISAINRGFTDAEVVIDNGGVIERIKKN